MQRAFYPEPAVCHVTVLHPPGGIVGGDSLQISAMAKHGTNSLVTTPGAAKFYRSAGAEAQVQQCLSVGDASLEWFPQENIFFNGCKAHITTTIKLEKNSRYCGWDIQCFGRPAGQHYFHEGCVDSSLKLLLDEEPALFDRLRVNAQHRTDQSTGLRGHCVSGTLVLYPVHKGSAIQARSLLEPFAGFACTELDSILLVRYLGNHNEIARQGFTATWSALRKTTNGHTPCVPRIWLT